MQFYKHKEFGNIFIMTRQPSIQPNVREYIELETNNHHLITSDLLEPVAFQEAFSDEIESIIRQYKDALHQCQASHTKISIELEQVKTAKEMDLIMNLESDLDYRKKIHEKDIDKLNEVHEANSKLRKEIENLKIERDQLVIDYDELERKQFDNVIDNNEYALKTENDSLKKAIGKLSDLAAKFYLKSEGITI